MRISASKWKRYTGALARINQEASQKMIDYAKKNGLEDGEALVRYAKALTDTYCEGSSSLACEMYDEIARLQGAMVSPAEPADLPEYGEVAKSVYGTLKQSPD